MTPIPEAEPTWQTKKAQELVERYMHYMTLENTPESYIYGSDDPEDDDRYPDYSEALEKTARQLYGLMKEHRRDIAPEIVKTWWSSLQQEFGTETDIGL